MVGHDGSFIPHMILLQWPSLRPARASTSRCVRPSSLIRNRKTAIQSADVLISTSVIFQALIIFPTTNMHLRGFSQIVFAKNLIPALKCGAK
jgi:hypothetical protein